MAPPGMRCGLAQASFPALLTFLFLHRLQAETLRKFVVEAPAVVGEPAVVESSSARDGASDSRSRFFAGIAAMIGSWW